MNQKQLELKAPFPLEAHYFKPGATTRDKSRALALTYVDSRQYQDRLDQVDPGWTVSYTPMVVDSRIVVNCKLSISGVTREDVGECSLKDENAYTSAVAQAFKRTCAQFGLGRYLYDIPRAWAEYDGGKKRFTDRGSKALRQALAKTLEAGGASGNGNDGRTQPGTETEVEPKAEKAGSNGKGSDGNVAIPPVSEKVTRRARAVELAFGKHEGKTLGEVFDEEPKYIEWLADRAEDDKVRAAAGYLMQLEPSGNGKVSLEDALAAVMPFGTRDHPEYRGKTLSEIEEADPDLVDWLADKARSPNLREAAEVIVASRN